MDSLSLDASDYAAWWGAIIASLALLWNIVTAIRDGPKINTRVNPNMQYFPEDDHTAGKKYICLTATNVGRYTVTVTSYCGYYANSLREIIMRKQQHFIVNVTRELSSPLPHVLEPGTQWKGMLDQGGFYEENSAPKYLFVGIAHSHSKKVKYVRVRLE